MSICITELSGIDNIGFGIELELPSSELELNCLKDFVPDSELNCYYRNWIAKTELTPSLTETSGVFTRYSTRNRRSLEALNQW